MPDVVTKMSISMQNYQSKRDASERLERKTYERTDGRRCSNSPRRLKKPKIGKMYIYIHGIKLDTNLQS